MLKKNKRKYKKMEQPKQKGNQMKQLDLVFEKIESSNEAENAVDRIKEA